MLAKYLEKLNAEEGVGGFAIDSLQKKNKILKVSYPNENFIVVEQKRAMIDLDGTIHKYSQGYKDGTIYDDAFKDAKDVIEWLKSNGYEIVIFTTRASEINAIENGGDHNQQIDAVANWLKLNGIYFDKITAEKLGADFYIDDKAICIKNGDWKSVKDVIIRRMKYNNFN